MGVFSETKYRRTGCILLLSILIPLMLIVTVSRAAEYKDFRVNPLDQVIIPANGITVESGMVLTNHVRYAIIVTGTYRYDIGEPGEFADAQYREDDNDQWTIRWNSVEFDGIRLAANAFDLAHHTYTFYVTGQGRRMTFRIYDESGRYGDNEGSLTATIYSFRPGVDRDPYANIVLGFQVGGTGNTHTDPAAVLGPPSCGTFDLSLGGGWLIVDMGEGEEIKNSEGNDLRVYESAPSCGGGQADAYAVFVSAAPDGPWYEIGTGNGVTEFDIASTGLSVARYVRIEDRASGSPTLTPGADIDAIEAINLTDLPPTLRLSLPFDYDTRAHYDDLITSYFDHNFPQAANFNEQPPDYEIAIYTGDFARRSIGRCDSELPAYTLVDGHDCIWYDGHDAYDYGIGEATQILASAPGTIESVAHLYDGQRDLGYQVVVSHTNSYQTTYLHITPTLGITKGITVERGQTIGTVERFYYDPHLHFTVRHNGRYTDPYGWWGTMTDPLADHGGESSRWLWDFPAPITASISVDTGGAIRSGSGDLLVSIPAHVYSESVAWRYIAVPAQSRVELSDLENAGHSFSLAATDQAGNQVVVLSAPVTLTVFYEMADILDIVENTLSLYRWDNSSSSWISLMATDSRTEMMSNHRVSSSFAGVVKGQTNRLGTFALLGKPKQKVYLPVIQR